MRSALFVGTFSSFTLFDVGVGVHVYCSYEAGVDYEN